VTPVLAGLLVGVGLLVTSLARVRLNGRRVRDLRQVLELQSVTAVAPADPEHTNSLLARSGLLAERALGDNALTWARRVLERSDWALSPGEFAVVTGLVTVAAGAIGFLSGGMVLALVVAAVAACTPYAAAVRSVSRRRRAFDEQFPALLDLLAGSLESGASVGQALQLVVEEVDEPAAGEFGRVLAATSMGVPLGEALTAAADRIGSTDLTWTVQAIVVQQRTGGRLADVLRIVARTMRNRFELQRELRALTAEGRLSAYILGGLPFALAALLLLVNPHCLNPLFHDPIGYLLVAVSGTLMLVAFAWMSRIVRVEV
jgi:tight adherence protein B